LAQFNWTYLDQNNRAHHVGIFHGDRTGHVIVYCNKKVVTIDFKVLESKSYSLFIEEELCQIEIRQKGPYQFSYHFNIDKEVNTPLNQQRKAKERKHWKQTLLFFGSIVFFAFLVMFAGKCYHNHQANQLDNYFAQMDAATATSTGKVLKVDTSSSNPIITYGYVANTESYTAEVSLHRLEASAFPIQVGDEFNIKFNPQSPNICMLVTSQPTDNQIANYVEKVYEIHSQSHPNLTKTHILCQLNIAFELKQIDGLADFYYQNTAPEKNPTYNTLTYQRLVRDLPFKNRVNQECW